MFQKSSNVRKMVEKNITFSAVDCVHVHSLPYLNHYQFQLISFIEQQQTLRKR